MLTPRYQEWHVCAVIIVPRATSLTCLIHASSASSVASMVVKVRQGIESELARRLVKTVKDSKVKVQVAVQGDQLRVTGKKRDILQGVISLLKEEKVDMPLQFINFRD